MNRDRRDRRRRTSVFDNERETVMPQETQNKRPLSPRCDHNFRKPKLKLPPGACDTHFHFLGPQTLYPLKADHTFSHLEFEDDTIEDWLNLNSFLGFTRGVHVLSMMYRNNYEVMLHSLCRFPDRLRGVIEPFHEYTDREMGILTEAGVVGGRFCMRLIKDKPDERLIARIHDYGWAAHYLFGPAEMEAWGPTVLRSPGNFVIEHMFFLPDGKSLDGPEFKFLLTCLDTGRCWIKLSPRLSVQQTFPFDDCLPFVRKLVELAPSRLLWGSDWPHPQYFKPMPNDADLVDIMLDWVPDERVRTLIFADNPAECYGFPAVK
jgi:2-pyrone-4,6-dicarboxylate lactonase